MIVHEETPQIAREDQPAPTCCHYWIIETANGPISRGECEICHEVRDFKNSVFDMDRGSQDIRSRKQTVEEESGQETVAIQVSGDLNSGEADQEPVVAELDPVESEMEEAEFAEPEVEEPEFVGVLED